MGSKLDWTDKKFRDLKDGVILDYFNNDTVDLNFNVNQKQISPLIKHNNAEMATVLREYGEATTTNYNRLTVVVTYSYCD